MRLYEYDITLCNCGCGLPVSQAHDKEQIFIVDEDVCYARRSIEKVRAKKREDAMRAKKGEGWDAGLKLHARPVTREQALAHMEKQHQSEEGEPVVGPRIAAATAQRAERDQRLAGRAREQQAQRRRVGGGR
jgi:hypothetical protein